MCNLIKKSEKEEFIGYKVVAKKGKKYYSIALGFEYKQPKHVFNGIRTKQKAIITCWAKILNPMSDFFSDAMVGRTAAIASFKKTMAWKNTLRFDLLKRGYDLVIVKVKLTGDLMEGNYEFPNFEVVAGRTMEILEEVRSCVL